MTRPTLSPGAHGDAVLAARQRLEKRGYETPHPDGKFYGQHMVRAVVRFQRHVGLKPDAIIGPKTWAALTHRPEGNANQLTTAEAFALACKRRVTGRDGADRPSYSFGAEVPDLSVKHPMRLDCSELVQWGVWQATKDIFIDGSYNQAAACKRLSVANARGTVGALVFLTDDNTASGRVHHVGVVCHERGKPYVAQARSAYTDPNCGVWPFDEQAWALAGLVRDLSYR